MKHIEVSVPGSLGTLDIYGKNLKVIDTEKLVITDGQKTIAVFSTFYYWRNMDNVEDDEHEPDKEAEQKIIEEKPSKIITSRSRGTW